MSGENPNAALPQKVSVAMEARDLKVEVWREYDFGGRVYRIESPAQLYVGATTHRVVDSAGIVHCVPAPGCCGCVVRWRSVDATKPVEF